MELVDIHICFQVEFGDVCVCLCTSLHVRVQSHGKGLCKWTEQPVGVELNDRTDCWTGGWLGPWQTREKRKAVKPGTYLAEAICCEMFSLWYSSTNVRFFQMKKLILCHVKRCLWKRRVFGHPEMLVRVLCTASVCAYLHTQTKIPKIFNFPETRISGISVKNTKKYYSCLFLACNVKQLYTMKWKINWCQKSL